MCGEISIAGMWCMCMCCSPGSCAAVVNHLGHVTEQQLSYDLWMQLAKGSGRPGGGEPEETGLAAPLAEALRLAAIFRRCRTSAVVVPRPLPPFSPTSAPGIAAQKMSMTASLHWLVAAVGLEGLPWGRGGTAGQCPGHCARARLCMSRQAAWCSMHAKVGEAAGEGQLSRGDHGLPMRCMR